jgi:hypothetical protein
LQVVEPGGLREGIIQKEGGVFAFPVFVSQQNAIVEETVSSSLNYPHIIAPFLLCLG